MNASEYELRDIYASGSFLLTNNSYFIHISLRRVYIYACFKIDSVSMVCIRVQITFYFFSIIPSHKPFPWNFLCIYQVIIPKQYYRIVSHWNKTVYQKQKLSKLYPVYAAICTFTCFWRNYKIASRIKITLRSIQLVWDLNSLQLDTLSYLLSTH